MFSLNAENDINGFYKQLQLEIYLSILIDFLTFRALNNITSTLLIIQQI